MRTPRIDAVEVWAIGGQAPARSQGTMQLQVRPLDAYRKPEGARSSPPQSDRLESLYLRIGTDNGIDGLYGPIDRSAAWVIVDQLAGFLVGEDALAGTVIWDKLARLDRHSRHGHFKMAISAVDNALWDVRGKAFDAPVHQLLGGPSRARLQAYASTLGTGHETAEISAMIDRMDAQGFGHQKWFFAHGPADGYEGLERNIALAERVREKAGPGTALMFDAFMGWDLGYARAWAKEAERFRPAWLEEPFPPATGYRRSRCLPEAPPSHWPRASTSTTGRRSSRSCVRA